MVALGLSNHLRQRGTGEITFFYDGNRRSFLVGGLSVGEHADLRTHECTGRPRSDEGFVERLVRPLDGARANRSRSLKWALQRMPIKDAVPRTRRPLSSAQEMAKA